MASGSDMAALDLNKAREFFALRYFGALWAVHAAAPHYQLAGPGYQPWRMRIPPGQT